MKRVFSMVLSLACVLSAGASASDTGRCAIKGSFDKYAPLSVTWSRLGRSLTSKRISQVTLEDCRELAHKLADESAAVSIDRGLFSVGYPLESVALRFGQPQSAPVRETIPSASLAEKDPTTLGKCVVRGSFGSLGSHIPWKVRWSRVVRHAERSFTTRTSRENCLTLAERVANEAPYAAFSETSTTYRIQSTSVDFINETTHREELDFVFRSQN